MLHVFSQQWKAGWQRQGGRQHRSACIQNVACDARVFAAQERAEQRLRAVNNAYETLSDAGSRQSYDARFRFAQVHGRHWLRNVLTMLASTEESRVLCYSTV